MKVDAVEECGIAVSLWAAYVQGVSIKCATVANTLLLQNITSVAVQKSTALIWWFAAEQHSNLRRTREARICAHSSSRVSIFCM